MNFFCILAFLTTIAIVQGVQKRYVFRYDDIEDYYHSDTQVSLLTFFMDRGIAVTAGIIGDYFTGEDTPLYTALQRCVSLGKSKCALFNHGADASYTYDQATSATDAYNHMKTCDAKIKSLFPGYTVDMFVPHQNAWNQYTLQAAKQLGYSAVSASIADYSNLPYDTTTDPLQLSQHTETGEYQDDGSWAANPIADTVAACETAYSKGQVCVIMTHPHEFASGAYTYTMLQQLIDALSAAGFTQSINFYDIIQEVKGKSSAPTVAPTAAVTKTPTLSPTVKTNVPTAKTTVVPTVTQTSVPSVAITTTPTFAKTIAPTIATTAAPTTAVTSKPTLSQTNAPTAAKTTVPTVAATVTVTSSPTASQTNAPTAGKTNTPSIQSTIPPTVKSTTAPTIPSTRNPTIKSTQAPSVKATRAPTVKVSPQPTSRRWRFTFNWYSWYSSSSVSSIAQVGTMSSSSAASIYQANAVNFFLDNNIGISAGIVANSFSDTDTELYTALKRCASAGSDQCQLIVEGGATTTTSSTLDVVKSQIQSADEKIKSYFPGYTPSVYVPTTTWNNNTLAAAKAVGFSAVAPAGNSIAWNLQSSPLQLSPQTSTGIQNTTGTWVANPTDSIVSDCTAAANRGEVCVIQITANEFASGAYTITQLQEVIDALKASGFSSDTVTLQTIISEAQATTPTLAPTNNPLTSSTGATDNGVWSPADYLIGVIVVAGLLIMAGITYAVILARNYNQNHDVIKINSSSSDLECASNDNLITGSVEIDEEKSLPSSIRRSVQYDEQYSVDVPRPPSGSREAQSPIVSEV